MLAAPSMAADKVKIGFLATFTGGVGVIGDDMRNAFELGLDHLGRKMGPLDVEVIYEDDDFKPDVGKQKTEKLVKRDRVNFVTGHMWSHVLLASYNSVVGQGPFLISANAGPSQIAGTLCHPDFFSTSWQNDQTPMAMGEVMNQEGIDNVYLMAPNYAAGKNMMEGFKRSFKGRIVGEDLTKFPDQVDFSAEMAKIRAANPKAVFIFYPGKFGAQFFTQYQQAGLKGKIPLYSAFTVDALNLPLLKDLAVGNLMTQFWSPDLDNPVNKRFVAEFKKKYGTFPSFYAAQSYDAAMLINSAVVAVKGDLTRKDAMRAAMEKADFPSVRGKFRYGNNHFPIQNFYLREAVKNDAGEYTTRTIRVVLKDHQDPYASECKM
ncbi:MAG: ABC transporter substrate-binding protein [Candidatus Lambdaproteobacteria bacterium]|nr:ABC transporter substrate-binding protein [Candidatus Lambdaproteobacteria bacterium]